MSAVAGIIIDDVVAVLDGAEARELTRRIKVGLEHSYTLIIAAYRGQAWRSMGYSAWDAYCQGEFGSLALQPPREDRQNVIMSMREAGMSIRAIGTATGSSYGTVSRGLEEVEASNQSGDPNGSPAAGSGKVVGRDGKSYPSVKPRPKHPDPPSFEDEPLSEELLGLSAGAIGIESLDVEAARRRRGVGAAAVKRLTGSMDAPLPLMTRLAGEMVDSAGLAPVDEEDVDVFSDLATDAARGILTLAHVLSGLDLDVFAGSTDDGKEVSGLLTDAIEELGRFLDVLHRR